MISFLYFVDCLLLYIYLRHCIRSNNVVAVNEIWKGIFILIFNYFDTLLVSWSIFKAINKTHYTQLCLYVQFVTTHVHPSMYKQIILMFTNIFKAIQTAIAH